MVKCLVDKNSCYGTRSEKVYYMGKIRVYEDNCIIFQEYSQINRLTKDDAMEDARVLKSNLEGK